MLVYYEVAYNTMQLFAKSKVSAHLIIIKFLNICNIYEILKVFQLRA
jgi:hypothetical protein